MKTAVWVVILPLLLLMAGCQKEGESELSSSLDGSHISESYADGQTQSPQNPASFTLPNYPKFLPEPSFIASTENGDYWQCHLPLQDTERLTIGECTVEILLPANWYFSQTSLYDASNNKQGWFAACAMMKAGQEITDILSNPHYLDIIIEEGDLYLGDFPACYSFSESGVSDYPSHSYEYGVQIESTRGIVAVFYTVDYTPDKVKSMSEPILSSMNIISEEIYE